MSEILIPTNSDKRKPQFKNNVIIAKSLSLFLSFSSLKDAFNNFWLSSNVKYLGNLLLSFGVSRFWAGFSLRRGFVTVKYLKNILIVEIFLAQVAGPHFLLIDKYVIKLWISFSLYLDYILWVSWKLEFRV